MNASDWHDSLSITHRKWYFVLLMSFLLLVFLKDFRWMLLFWIPTDDACVLWWSGSRCVKMTDSGLQQVLVKCSLLRSLNLYALSRYAIMSSLGNLWFFLLWTYALTSVTVIHFLCSFTDEAYKKISVLSHLRFLDLCGAQVKPKISERIYRMQCGKIETTNGTFDCQNLSDEGLSCIAKCKKLVSLNLTWLVNFLQCKIRKERR